MNLNLLFITPEGHKKISLNKEKVQMNPLLSNKVIDYANKKVGYLALESFLCEKIENKLDTVFKHFNQQNIDELIIDLRYNSGGNITTANHLANLIIGNQINNQKFIYLVFNNNLDAYYPDSIKTLYFKSLPNSLKKSLFRIFFITSDFTASASELLIKGLQPYMATYLIGTRTYGKPVGMIPIELETSEHVIVPIMFEWRNAISESSGYTGIGIDYAEFDDLTKELGDTNELCLKQALRYIEKESFDIQKKSKHTTTRYKRNWRGIRAEIGSY